jgi:hypothetical protein
VSDQLIESIDNSENFELALSSGGDERNLLLSTGLNRYHVHPVKDMFAFNRGSCTCNVLNPDVATGVFSLFQNLETGMVSLEQAREQQKERLRKMLHPPQESHFDFFFAPSGSDLCYYPILFSRLSQPHKKILSIVTCAEEIGTGSVLANKGLFHGEQTQVLEKVNKGTPVNHAIEIDVKTFSARDAESRILDHSDEISALIEKYHEQYAIIANFVIGSKSGIEDDIEIIKKHRDKDVMWVLDMCQLRATPDWVNTLLELDCCLMITGSKFYQGPPFSGAMLVPAKYLDKIKEANESLGFEAIFSYYDFPPNLSLRSSFPKVINMGLLLRWEAAILEMEKLSALEERRINYVITKWNMEIVQRIEKSQQLSLLQDHAKTNKSIVSFQVKDKDGRGYSAEKLRLLHKNLATLPCQFPGGATKAIMGQTVEQSEGAFLRLALGSYNVRKLLESGMDFNDDMYLIDLIEEQVQKMENLG